MLRFSSLVVALAALVCGHAMAQPPREGAGITRGTGRSRADNARDYAPIKTGEVLLPNVTLEASGDEPLVLNVPDGVVVTLEPGAKIRWKPPGRLPTEHNGWAHGYHLELNEGEIDVTVPSEPRGKRAFLVSTKAGTLTGWRGSVHVVARGETASAAIYEGALVVGSNGQGFPVYDGAGIVMKKGVNPDKSKPIPGAPAVAESGLALSVGHDTRPLSFAWSPVPTAASYRVEIADRVHRVIHRSVTPETRFVLPEALKDGQYFARVRAINAEGITGAWSADKRLASVRVELPPGATVAHDGAIVVAGDAAVRLLDAEGLEAAFDTGSAPLAFMRAPAYLRVGEGRGRIVHLRDANGATARLVLARRELKAAVEMFPRRARWPDDPVDVTVRVFDPSGRIDATTERITIEPMVNIDPVALAWQRDGAVYRTRVPPRAPPGPWVVRVAVKDSSGREIGGGSLEIVQTR